MKLSIEVKEAEFVMMLVLCLLFSMLLCEGVNVCPLRFPVIAFSGEAALCRAVPAVPGTECTLQAPHTHVVGVLMRSATCTG